MRDRTFWGTPHADRVRSAWPVDTGPARAPRLLRVELGLYLLERLCPGEPAIAAWTLLGGYPFALAQDKTTERERMLRVARHLLWPLRRPRTWERALQQYAAFPAEVRGYRIVDMHAAAVREEVSVLAERWQLYERALTTAPRFYSRPRLAIARTGKSYRFPQGKLITSVRLPRHLPVATVRPQVLVPPPNAGKPIETTLARLKETAEWMDRKLRVTDPRASWVRRVRRIELDVLDSTRSAFGSLGEKDTLSVSGLFHLVGMVGAGKSTLRDVLTVETVRQRRRVTVVVGDVAEQLRLVELFRLLELKVAPVLGASTRIRNVQRMHRRLTGAGAGSLLSHEAEHFTYLSTACPLDALRGREALQPLEFADSPCTRLYPATPRREGRAQDDIPQDTTEHTASEPPAAAPHLDPDDADSGRMGTAEGCPLWGACPRHRGAHALVDADIWVANPASLVYGLTPRHQNRERARFLEVACVRSDLIIVDEADRVQMQLDTMFVPSATLVGRSPDSWLDELQTHTTDEFARYGRLQLSDADVDRWSSSLTASIAATNRLYSMLMRHPSLQRWIRDDYFSSWTLQQKLLDEWFRKPSSLDAPDQDDEPDIDFEEEAPDETDLDEDLDDDSRAESEAVGELEDPLDARRAVVTEVLDAFRDDPLGGERTDDPELTDLIALARALLHTLDEETTRLQAGATLSRLSGLAPGSDADMRRRTLRFEFTLLVCVLQQRLDVLTELWPTVEAALNLESTDNQLARRPPLDYGPLLPESPMGNILGFQLLTENLEATRDPAGAELRFFRCTGVGRALLTGLHRVTALDDRPTAHVLLMSGTSWAGTAAGAHVLAPVRAILKISPKEQAALLRTTFRKVFVPGPDGRPLHLSGTRPDLRPKVLELILEGLARPREGQFESTLEEELRLITSARRKRLLLLVGSYDEARRAFEVLDAIPRWKGRVCRLVPDEAELEVSFGGADPGERLAATQSRTLRRGDVSAFGTMDAQILIAPLMSVERGHNILNDAGQAAIGSVFFLARPHPRPYDIGIAVQGINSWATRLVADGGFDELVASAPDLDAAGRSFRREARIRWKHLLTRRMAWRELNDEDKVAFTWDRLVVMWQVIGRLVRGGVPARVVFVDSRFAEREAAGRGPDDFRTGLLASLLHVLAPYFDKDGPHPSADRHLVKMLYEPLYQALENIPPYRPDAPRRTTRGAA
ncbi:signal recognition particle [Streptomyces sp. NPDC018045]|uniref:pPIWI_RE_Z domain-containing protein n=1 Tax=Streptomyces sp. NPDC018045 TaxID=3365037 RepID=UPI0037AB9431